MIKKTLLCLFTMITTIISVSCQENKSHPIVQYVMQPEIELGKTSDFYINFKVKPDSLWAETDHIDGLELTNGISEIITHINESTTTDDNGKVLRAYYNFYTYARPTRLGKINFPVLNIMVKGKRYQTAPFSVTVVEKSKIDQDVVKIELTADKAVYGLKDTVKISLYEFSKFTNASRKNVSKQASITGKGNEIRISSEQGLDEIAGIDGFEKYTEQHFEMEDFDRDPFKDRRSMEKINGIDYLKTLVFTASFLPKHKGEFKIDPSEFSYKVYKSNTDYLTRLVPNKDGKYSLTDHGSTTLKVVSQPITFEVK
jgi:hypothetical protein